MNKFLLALSLAGAVLVGPASWAGETQADPAGASLALLPAQISASPAKTATPQPTATVIKASPIIPDSGHTAWLMISSALVLLMTIPGLALFYGGMVRKKNVLSTMAHSLVATAVASLVWVVLGYSLAFSPGNAFIGGLEHFMLLGVKPAALHGTIPHSLFITFQMTFAIITVAIISGSIAERIRFGAFVVFIICWVLLVYAPVVHWVWGDGWLAHDGALDFAGGTVVHVNAGIAGLVAAYMLGPRMGLGRESMAPHNLTLTLIGASLLWVGWFGFNGGSALGANATASYAILVTQVAAAAATLSWLLMEKLLRGTASVLGGVSGAIAGLVVITPAAGFVSIGGALTMGLMGGALCFWGTTHLKRLLKADDALDAFGLHGVGGMVGALLTAICASKWIMGAAASAAVLHQLWIQLIGVLAVLIYSGVLTWGILKVIDLLMGLRVSTEDERMGLDLSQHGERVE